MFKNSIKLDIIIIIDLLLIERDEINMKKTLPSIWKLELREICRILKNNGIDIQKIPTTKTSTDGKRVPTTLKDINQEEINILKIIQENGLDIDFPIGYYIIRYRNAYNGTSGNLTKEEREDGEILGIVAKRSENAATPIFKGRKLSQFHLNFISGILDKILNGQINTREALEFLKQASIDSGETIIKDAGSVKRCVEILLKDRPEDLTAYYEMVRRNSRKRNPFKGKIGKPKIGLYHEKEAELKRHIIEQYLPLILSGQITLDMIEQELHCSRRTVDKIIEDYYRQNDDLDGLENYQKAKRENRGGSLETRKEAIEKRETVANYKVVTNNEFILLSPEQQKLQLIIKINAERLKEELSETSVRKSALISEDAIKDKINVIMNYFKSKNNSDEIYFSDEDIRYMIFRYPTLIRRSQETLEEKLDVLTSYDEIDEKTAYGMIKAFPAIMGYEASRTKGQLDLLEEEGLIDVVISNPRRFMQSINLMYALIQYAKERHHVSSLRNINRNNIFMPNSVLKRLYGLSYDEIKAKYPYIKEQDITYTIHPDEIGRATYGARKKSNITSNVLNEAINYPEIGINE